MVGLGTWNLFIVIDPDSWLVESNKGNNNSAPVTVTVQPPEYYITATASAGGRIHPLGRLPAPTCEPMYFFAWPDEGYEIEGWYVDGVLRDSGMGTYFTYYDSVVEDGVDTLIEARFRPILYPLNMEIEGNGSVIINPLKDSTVPARL